MRMFEMRRARKKVSIPDREWRKIELKRLGTVEAIEVERNILWNIKELGLLEKGIREYSDRSSVKLIIQSNIEWWRELLYDYNEVMGSRLYF